MNNTTQTPIEIDHIELAAVLMTFNAKLINVNRSNPKRCVFNFVPSDVISELIPLYFNSEVVVEPKQLFASLRTLKNLIHNHY